MHGRRLEKQEKRQKQRRKDEIRGYLKAGFLGLCAGIVLVFASMAMKVMAASEISLQGMDYQKTVQEAPLSPDGSSSPDSVSGNQASISNGLLRQTGDDGKEEVSGENRRLAQLIHQETVKSTGAEDRELMSDSELYVTSRTAMPSCLIETGFLSNDKEREKLSDREYQEQIAEGIVNGIDLYLNPKTMYLTFDDGPSEGKTEAVLDILARRNIKATFFVIGEYVRKNPEIAKRIVEEGHTIGIHCDVHDYKTLYQSVDSYVADFEKAYQTVLEVTGVEAKLFRFPGGSVNGYNKHVRQGIIEEMEKRGFIYYDWNASVEDAVRREKTAEELVQTAKDTSLGRKRVVLLAHDRIESTVQALEALIDAFPEYKMEPLAEDLEPVHF